MPPDRLETLRQVNQNLRSALARLRPEKTHCSAIRLQDFSSLLAELLRASECLRPGPDSDDTAALEAGFEFMGHGFVQGPMHRLDNQADAIKRAVDTIAKFAGKPPRSWESPGLTETDETLDLLRLNGIEYVADWVIDDLPQDIATPHGTITSIPYSVETNDIVIHALQHLPSEQFLKRCTDQFDRLYLEGATNARVMAISIHPYITGVPHRIKYLEALLDYVIGHDGVALMTASDIGDWYRAEMSKY